MCWLFIPLFDDVPPDVRLIWEVSQVVVRHNHAVCLLCVLQHKSVETGKDLKPNIPKWLSQFLVQTGYIMYLHCKETTLSMLTVVSILVECRLVYFTCSMWTLRDFTDASLKTGERVRRWITAAPIRTMNSGDERTCVMSNLCPTLAKKVEFRGRVVVLICLVKTICVKICGILSVKWWYHKVGWAGG